MKALLAATAMLAASSASAHVFTMDDAHALSAMHGQAVAIQKNLYDATNAIPRFDVSRISAYSLAALNLQAATERFDSVLMLVTLAANVESPSDEIRILTALDGSVLAPAVEFLEAKRQAILGISAVYPGDVRLVREADDAASLLGDKMLPALRTLARALNAGH